MTPNPLMPQEAAIPPDPQLPPDAVPQRGPDPAFAIPSSTTPKTAGKKLLGPLRKPKRAEAATAQPAPRQSSAGANRGQPTAAASAAATDSLSDVFPLSDPPRSQAQIDAELAARKRQEIGLSPRRTTAQNEVLRPPAQRRRTSALQWLAMAGLAVVALILVWMITSRVFASQPTVASLNAQFNAMLDSSVRTASTTIAELSSDPAALLRPAGSLPIREEFNDETGPLVRDFQPRRWSMGPVAAEGIYRIRMWPGIIAWSTLGVNPVPAYTLTSEMTISDETPWGFGGLMARYSDPRNLLFAQIDGKGRYRVQMQENGVWSTLQDWTAASAIQNAGLPNTLSLVDNGAFAIFYVNGEPIYTTPNLAIPPGDAGVLAGSLDPSVAEANFERIEMSALE